MSRMVDEPPDDYPYFCSICGEPDDRKLHPTYANPVCDECDDRAVTEPGSPAEHGDNPVFIDGIRCFRRYKMGGWLSMRDTFGCEDYEEFYDKHYDDYGPIHTFNQPDPSPDGRDIRQLTELNASPGDKIVTRVLESDILEVEADALICGITTDPSLDGGVAGAVCDASDYALRPLVQDKIPIQLGDVVVTGGYDLPYSYLVFVAATPAEAGKDATEASVSDAIRNGLHQVAELRLPTVALPLVGAGAGGLDANAAASAIVSGIQTSGVSPPICTRIVVRNSSDRKATAKALPSENSRVISLQESDPLEDEIYTVLEQVDKSGDIQEWEVYEWVRFDPYSGGVSKYDNGEDSTQIALSEMGFPDKAKELIEDTRREFVTDRGIPEQWLARFESFNSQMGGIRASIGHPELDRTLYIHEQALVGMLRGLEHPDSEYDEILELALETPARSPVEENVACLRYQLPDRMVETSDDIEAEWLQTALHVVEHTVETLSHLDFEHEMSDMLAVEPVDSIEIIGHAYSQRAFLLDIPIDIAEDLSHLKSDEIMLRDVSSTYRNEFQ